MVEGEALALPAEAVAEAKGYLRVAGSDEDALIARACGAAAELCEGFTRRVLISRAFAETLSADGAWRRLTMAPVRAITLAERVADDGSFSVLTADAYASDIDADGDGWFRLTQAPAQRRVRVTYQAGLATDWADAPVALRQGVLRLAGHFYAERSGGGGGAPPAAVSALWRPWRRMAL